MARSKDVLERAHTGLALAHHRIGVDHLVAAAFLLDNKGPAVKLVICGAGLLARGLHAVPDLGARHILEAGVKQERDGLRVLVDKVVGRRARRVQVGQVERLRDFVLDIVDVHVAAIDGELAGNHGVVDDAGVPGDVRRERRHVLKLVAGLFWQDVQALGGMGHARLGEVRDLHVKVGAVDGAHLAGHGIAVLPAGKRNVVRLAVKHDAGAALGIGHRPGHGIRIAVLGKLRRRDGHAIRRVLLHRVARVAAVEGGEGDPHVLVDKLGDVARLSRIGAVKHNVRAHLAGKRLAHRKLGDRDGDLGHLGLYVEGNLGVGVNGFFAQHAARKAPALGNRGGALVKHPGCARQTAHVCRGVPRKRAAVRHKLLITEKNFVAVLVHKLYRDHLICGLGVFGERVAKHQDDASVVCDLDALGIGAVAQRVPGIVKGRDARTDLVLERDQVELSYQRRIDGGRVVKDAVAVIVLFNVDAADLNKLRRIDARVVLGDDVAHLVAVLDGNAAARDGLAAVGVHQAVGVLDADVKEEDVRPVVGPQGHVVVGHPEADLAGLVGREPRCALQALDGPVVGNVAVDVPVVAVDRDRRVVLPRLDLGRIRSRRRVQRHVIARDFVDQPDSVVDLLDAPPIVICREAHRVGDDLLSLGRDSVPGGIGAGPVLQADKRIGGQRQLIVLGDAVVVLVVVVLDVGFVGGLLGNMEVGVVARPVGVALHHDLAAKNREGRRAAGIDLNAAAVAARGRVVGDRAVDKEGRRVVDVDAAAARHRRVQAVVVDLDVAQGHGGASAVDAAALGLLVGGENRVVRNDAYAIVIVLVGVRGLVVGNRAAAAGSKAHAAAAHLGTVACDLAVVKHGDLCRGLIPHADAAAL